MVLYFLIIVGAVGLVIVGLALLYVFLTNSSAKADILADPNPLARWVYTPAEWEKALEEFDWGKPGGTAQVIITRTNLYIGNERRDRLIALSNGVWLVTYASYRGTAESPLKLRVRCKVEAGKYDGEDTRYHKKDYRIPVPLREKEAAQRVADFFTAELENNLAAYAAVVPQDEPISLFGKDSF